MQTHANLVTKATSRILKAAEILACATTPIEIIPAPGAGKLLLVIATIYQSSAGAAYNGVGNCGLYYGSPSHQDAFDHFTEGAGIGSGFAGGQLVFSGIPAGLANDAIANYVNQPINFGGTANPGGGTWDLTLDVIYQEVDLGQ